MAKKKKFDNKDKAKKFRMMRPAVGENYMYNFSQPSNTQSTHLATTYEADGKFWVIPSITNKKAPYANTVYKPQSFREAMDAGEGIPFNTQEEAEKFAQGSWKLPQYPRPEYSHGGSHDTDLDKVKKGLRYVESSDGLKMINPNSSATGLYGQLYSAEELQNMSYLQGVDRQSFASDTTLQNRLFEDRYFGKIPGVPGLGKNANDLRVEYKKVLEDKGISFNYTDDEISALSNLLGRQGTREYFGYVLRDGRSLANVFPKIYGEDAEAPNKTPEKYLETYRIGRDLKYGGNNMKKINKYENGGDPPKKKPVQLQFDPSNPFNPYGDPSFSLQKYNDAITRDSTLLEDALSPGLIAQILGMDEALLPSDYADKLGQKLLKNRVNRQYLKPYTEQELYDINYRQYGGKAIPQYKGGGLWANIHAKRKRIAGGSGERMRKPGSKGAPTNEAIKNSQAAYGGMLPEYNFGGFLGGALGGLAGSIPIVGGALNKGIAGIASNMGADMESNEAQMGNIFGGLSSMVVNPAAAAGKVFNMGDKGMKMMNMLDNKGGKGGFNPMSLMNMFAEDGGKFTNVDFEAEDGEVIVGDVKVNRAYNGGTMKSYKGGGMHILSGPRHSSGGIGIMQFGGKPSYVFSNNKDLKVDKSFGKFNTYADAVKGKAKDLENIAEMRMGGEGYDRTTADMMDTLAMGEVKNLYDAQEKFKADNNIQNPVKMASPGGTFDPSQSSFLQYDMGLSNTGNNNFSLNGINPSFDTNFNIGDASTFGNMNLGTFSNPTGDVSPGTYTNTEEEDAKLPGWMKAAAIAPGLFNMAKGLIAKAPTMDLGRLDKQDYMDFSPLERTYLGMQDRNLASLRASLEGSGATGAQLRGGLQAGHSTSQAQAGQFYGNLAQQTATDRRATDTANIGIADKNMQRELMEDQFMMQYDPKQSFVTGLENIGSGLVNLGMDHLRLQNMDTANYGAYGDFKDYEYDPRTGEKLV